jgi:hypothetical protein
VEERVILCCVGYWQRVEVEAGGDEFGEEEMGTAGDGNEAGAGKERGFKIEPTLRTMPSSQARSTATTKERTVSASGPG